LCLLRRIYNEVKKARAVKKVVVSMGSVAASGGYYISAPADRIVANPGTITGSIGVIMVVPNLKGLLEKVGIKTEVVKSGKNKDLASVFRGIGDEERQIIQGVMDDVHEQFIAAVAEGRKMEIDKTRKISDGRIFSGRQAIGVGLVDEIGDLDDAVKVAGKLAGIDGEPVVVSKSEKGVISKTSGREDARGTFSCPSRSASEIYVLHVYAVVIAVWARLPRWAFMG